MPKGVRGGRRHESVAYVSTVAGRAGLPSSEGGPVLSEVLPAGPPSPAYRLRKMGDVSDRLEVKVVAARGLGEVEGGDCNPFALVRCGAEEERTAVASATSAPEWNASTMIFTDDLVNLAEDDNELTAILAHEIGHVAHNHGMKGMVQSSLTFWLIVMMTGDLSAFSDATVVVPAVMMSLSYSRDMEREADAYALKAMTDHDLDPTHFVTIMERLMAAHGEDRSSEAEEGTSRWDSLRDMLSSHPETGERIERFKQTP